ncbi:hypothetical protein PLICRDRAFT_104292 [Plicaturopsis crispa FD-325 SS-3]|nr:hypothetical protein PLICRDRAFT_104292 [Plicaturopsis crispa FD-325 SS-3]
MAISTQTSSKTHRRRDGRAPNELRALSIVFERLARVDGSARFSFGDTESLASLSGPIEVRLAAEHPAHATLEIHVRPSSRTPATASKARAAALRSALTPALFLNKCPRTLVQIVVQEGDGAGGEAGLVAAGINAATMALVNAASVPMKGVVCAVAVGRLPSDASPILVLDPSEAEHPHLLGGGVFAFLFSAALAEPSTPALPHGSPPSSSLIYTSYTPTTAFDASELAEAREMARRGAEDIWRSMWASVKSCEGVGQTDAMET